MSINKGTWGPFAVYPQVSGHEIIGTISLLGVGVRGLSLGQRVGVGAHCGCCGRCALCLHDEGAVCAKTVITCAGGTIGGFAKAVRVSSDWAFAIPDSLTSEHAAPLMCGGISVYHPLAKYARPGCRVGVVGIGGLGHMAVLFAKARGCLVTAFSSSADKAPLAKELGVTTFVNTSDATAMAAAAESIDVLLITIGGALDHAPLYNLMARLGVVVYLGAVQTPISIAPFPLLITRQLTITANATGGRGKITEMLQFAADFGVKPVVEVYDFKDINDVLARVDANLVRFRAVLKW